jgi:hypothetical protein
MPDKRPKRPRDPAQLAKLMIDLATMDEAERDALKKRAAAKKKPRQGKGSKGSVGK